MNLFLLVVAVVVIIIAFAAGYEQKKMQLRDGTPEKYDVKRTLIVINIIPLLAFVSLWLLFIFTHNW